MLSLVRAAIFFGIHLGVAGTDPEGLSPTAMTSSVRPSVDNLDVNR
jgi:hypothetical protein